MRHMMSRHTMAAILSIIVICAAAYNCFAYDVEFSHAEGIIYVSGTVKSDEEVSLLVLKKGYDIGGFAASPTPQSLILCSLQTTADENGEFTFAYLFDGEKGLYNAYITSASTGVLHEEIESVNFSDYKSVIQSLNTFSAAGDEENFIRIIRDNELLFVTDALSKSIDLEKAMKMFCSDTAKEPIIAENTNREAANLYETFVVIQGINEKKNVDLKLYIKKLCIENDTKEVVQDVLSSSNASKHFDVVLKNKVISDCSGLDSRLKEAAILAKVRYPGGYSNAKVLLQKYGDFLGIDTISDEVCQKICGQAYYNTAELRTAISAAEKASGGSVGKGSGGGSFVGTRSEVGVSGETIAKQPKSISVKFKDIDGFMWANAAIVALSDKHILNGRSETRFCPGENVTREEFVKIVMCMRGGEYEKPATSSFGDVDCEQWYATYVEAAYKDRIIKGISEDTFGVGKFITRQDLAVMIYNASSLKENGKEMQGKPFADVNDCADYAVEAINALSSVGVVQGNENGAFLPDNYATRAEAAQIAYKMLEYLN